MAGVSSKPSNKILKPTNYEKELIGEMIESDITCAICLETFLKPHGLDCKHVYCQKCVMEWMRNHNTCPMCRKTILRAPIKCEWLESIIETLKGTPLSQTSLMTHRRRSSLSSVNGSLVHRRNSGKENSQRPPWRS